MTTFFDGRRRWAVSLGLGAVLGCAGLVVDNGPPLALVNESPSVPRGVYLRAPGARADRAAMVAVRQPAAARPYLKGVGMPAEVLLIKRVAAVGGDRVCRRGDRLEAGVRRVTLMRRDRRGVALPAWGGCRRLGPDELFLLGDSPTSYDSRYFGPVPVSDVQGVFREAATW